MQNSKVILGGVFGLSLLTLTASATLIVCVYHEPAIYIGADSLGSNPTNGITVTPSNSISTSHTKLFQIGPTSCAAIAGLAGGLDHSDTNQAFNLADTFERICNDAFALETKNDKVSLVVNRFSSYYESFLKTFNQVWKTNLNVQAVFPNRTMPFTKVITAGYDPKRASLFATTYKYSNTNETIIEEVITNKESVIRFFGDGRFLSEMFQSKEERFARLRSPEFVSFEIAFDSTNAIPDTTATRGLLEMFRLHEEYASLMGLNNGRIGKPYIIYKITAEGTKRLH